MAERIKGLQIDLSLNDMGIGKKLSAIKREFRALNTSMKVSNNNFKFGEKSAASYKARMSELKTAVNGSTKNLDQLKKRHAEVSAEQGAGSRAALNYANEINRETDTLNMYRDQLSRVTAEYRENYSVSGMLSRGFNSIGNGFKAVGTKAQSVGSSLTSHITKPAGIAATAMAGITAKMGFDRLKGLDTAKAKLEGLGYSGKEVKSITDQVTDAVKGGMTTLGEGTDIAAGALAAGVKQGKDLKKYIQLVGDAAAGANRPVNEMATIFNRVQGQGKLMTEELNSIEDGMPGFSQAMAKHYGVSMEKFRDMVSDGKVQSEDFLEVMDDFAGGMASSYANSWEGMVQNTKAYIGQIGQGFLQGSFQQAKSSLKELEDLLSSDSVQQWAQSAGESLSSGINIMVNKIKELVDWWKGLDSSTQQTIGEVAKWSGIVLVAIGPLLTIFGKLAGTIGGMFGVFGNFIGLIGKVGFAIKDAGGLIGGLASAFPKLAGVIGAITSPIGLTVAAIIGLGTAFVIAYKKSETFRNIVNNAFNAVKDTLSAVWNNVIKPVMGKIAEIFGEVWGKIKDSAGTILPDLLSGFTRVFGRIGKIISGLSAIIKAIMPGLKAMFKSTFDGIGNIVTGATDVILGIVKVFAGLFGRNFESMWDGVKQIFSGAINIVKGIVKASFVGQIVAFIKGMYTTLIGWFKKLWQGTVNIFNNLKNSAVNIWNAIKNAVVNKAQALWNGVKNHFNNLKNSAVNIFNSIKAFAVGVWTSIKNTVVRLAQNLWNGVKNHFNSLKNGVVAIFNNVKAFAVRVWTGIKNSVVKLAQGLWNGVRNKFNALKSGVANIFKAVKNTVINIWTSVKKKVGGLASSMKDNVLKVLRNMRDGIKGIVDKIKGFFTGMVTAVKQGLNKLIDGVNWVGGKLGMKKLGKIKLSTGTETTETRNVITNGKINQDTFATVGDKGRGNGPHGFRNEIIRYPNGKMTMTPDQDTTAYLPKGSRVFNGQQTFNALTDLPRFAKGTLWDKTKSAVGKGTKWLKGKVDDVMDFVGHPGKLLDHVLKAFGVNFDFVEGSLPKALMDGLFKKLKTAVKNKFAQWLKKAEADGDAGGKHGNPGGAGVQRWKKLVKKALRANKLSTSAAMVNKILSQINTESGGNPKAMGGTDGLADGRAMGLMQTKPGTFKAYAFKGHGDIWNGYDNLLSALHYAKVRYGAALSFLGHGHGYASGGFIKTPGMYNLAEGKFPEFVIPTDPSKQSDAMKLLALASQQINRQNSNKRPNQLRAPISATNSTSTDGYAELNRKFDTLLAMFGRLLGVSDAQLNAIKNNNPDKQQQYKQQAADQILADYQALT
ncbi:tape measure protein [Loigolactobacillus rennini]|uniref:Uncharacterized protein n=1 Tax=Loigolactobacillus rennini DSM 20253 TaxID=1423796 RepID=A0A0R2CU94_9LACO|nr:tape measure protein [Loigolactobacillus rennini]KRM95336.1 hypothetical protein FC24_GL002154 [Loigolactobacillus rennini DSM 20253]